MPAADSSHSSSSAAHHAGSSSSSKHHQQQHHDQPHYKAAKPAKRSGSRKPSGNRISRAFANMHKDVGFYVDIVFSIVIVLMAFGLIVSSAYLLFERDLPGKGGIRAKDMTTMGISMLAESFILLGWVVTVYFLGDAQIRDYNIKQVMAWSFALSACVTGILLVLLGEDKRYQSLGAAFVVNGRALLATFFISQCVLAATFLHSLFDRLRHGSAPAHSGDSSSTAELV
jgi:hypothetical protein